MSPIRFIARWASRLLLLLVALIMLVAVGLWLFVHEGRPRGQSGLAADAMARRMVRAVNGDAWARTGAVAFRFSKRHSYLWDRQRGLVRVRYADKEVLLRLADQRGRAFQQGRPLRFQSALDARITAYRYFINDSFWLNPIPKVLDSGVRRELWHGGPHVQLLTHFGAGGVTPGDSYAWSIGPTGRPISWRLWVSILPVGGLRTTWEGWQQLQTGAWVATKHRVAGIHTISIDNLRAAVDLATLQGTPGGLRVDPFAPLGQLQSPPLSAPASSPASVPASAPGAPSKAP